MVDRVARVREIFSNSHSCSQALLMGFADCCGLDEAVARRLGRALGMGMGQGEVCGAVSGALAVVGCLVPDAERDRDARETAYGLAREFSRRFVERQGSLRCGELLGGLDLGTPEGYAEAVRSGVFTSKCPLFVQEAARILMELKPEETN